MTLASLVDWYAGRWPESGFIGYPLASLVVVPTAGVALARTVDMLEMPSGPVALFVIGANLHGLHLGGMLSNLRLIVLGKLVLHPLAVLGALLVFPVASPELHTAAILKAAVPMLSIYLLFGHRFGLEKLCSSALLGATLLSFNSLTVVLAMLKSLANLSRTQTVVQFYKRQRDLVIGVQIDHGQGLFVRLTNLHR